MRNNIFKNAESALKKTGIHYNIESEKVISFGIKGDDCKLDVVLSCDEEREILTTLVSCSLIVPSIKMNKMCRWIADRNLEVVCGCFQLDTSDGKLYFRLTCPIDTEFVSEKFVEKVYSKAVHTFNFYYDDIIKALYFENIDEDFQEIMTSESQNEPKQGKDNKIFS